MDAPALACQREGGLSHPHTWPLSSPNKPLCLPESSEQDAGAPVRGLSWGSVSAPAASDNPAELTGHPALPCNLHDTATPRRGKARPTPLGSHTASRCRTWWRSRLHNQMKAATLAEERLVQHFSGSLGVSRAGEAASAEQEAVCAGSCGGETDAENNTPARLLQVN